MTRITMLAIAAVLSIPLLAVGLARAQDGSEIVGSWEGLDTEAGELYRLVFSDDGGVSVKVFNVDFGFYLVDEERHLITVYEDEEQLKELSEDDWAPYKVQGDRLTVMAGTDEQVVFLRIERPEKATSPLVGRWQAVPEESSAEYEAKELEVFLTFNNDGSGSFEELDEAMIGRFSVDPESGVIRLTFDDEVEEGAYVLEGDGLTITVDGETHVLKRVN